VKNIKKIKFVCCDGVTLLTCVPFPVIIQFFSAYPLMSWFVPLGVRLPQVGNHSTTVSVTVRPTATSQIICQQVMYNTNEVVNL